MLPKNIEVDYLEHPRCILVLLFLIRKKYFNFTLQIKLLDTCVLMCVIRLICGLIQKQTFLSQLNSYTTLKTNDDKKNLDANSSESSTQEFSFLLLAINNTLWMVLSLHED